MTLFTKEGPPNLTFLKAHSYKSMFTYDRELIAVRTQRAPYVSTSNQEESGRNYKASVTGGRRLSLRAPPSNLGL